MTLLLPRFLKDAAASAAVVAAAAAFAFGCTSDTPATSPPPTTEAPTPSITAAPTPAPTPDRADGASTQPTATVTATATPSGDGAASVSVADMDRAALEALYDSTGGADWLTTTNWLTDAPLGDWHGVTIDEEGRVTALELPGNGLARSIPGKLLELTSLTTLDLSDNSLSGVHSAWSRSPLTSLAVLDLSDNDLPGSIAWLAGFESLVELNLSNNSLEGPIPPEIGSLAGLTALSLDGNWLWGPIPAGLGNLTNLKILSLSSNNLGGPIPSELGGLSQLTELSLADNDLQGPIPAELSNLTNLTTLSLSENGLSGPILPELGGLSQLTELSLGGNKLSGGIPAELVSLTSLTRLSLWGNNLSGSIPGGLGRLENLTYLDVAYNELSGPIPPELGQLSSLEIMSLAENNLSGPIPSELAGLTKLSTLYLWENDLRGPIPAGVWNLPGLTSVSLDDNRLSGEIPDAACSLAKLTTLHLSRNELSGSLPDCLGAMDSLDDLQLRDNRFSGTIPDGLFDISELQVGGNNFSGCLPDDRLDRIKVDTFFSSLPLCSGNPAAPDSARDREALVALYESTNGQLWRIKTNWLSDRPLGEWYGVTTDRQGRVVALEITGEQIPGTPVYSNNLSGELPEEIGNLDKLGLFVIIGFQDEVRGEIPASVGKLEELGYLVLRSLELQGEIPNLERLGHLRQLDLSYNNLSGEIPDSLRYLSDLESVNLGNNRPRAGLAGGLSGPIPTWIGRLGSLSKLHLGGKQLIGPIPESIGDLGELTELGLSPNNLSGMIPAGLIALVPKLEILLLAGNDFTGPVPESFRPPLDLDGNDRTAAPTESTATAPEPAAAPTEPTATVPERTAPAESTSRRLPAKDIDVGVMSWHIVLAAADGVLWFATLPTVGPAPTLLAYDLSTGARDPARDLAFDQADPITTTAIATDGVTMHVYQQVVLDARILHHRIATDSPAEPARHNFFTRVPNAYGNVVRDGRLWFVGGNGLTEVYSYDLGGEGDRRFEWNVPGLTGQFAQVRGLTTDGDLIYAVSRSGTRVIAIEPDSGAEVVDRSFDLDAKNDVPDGIVWADGVLYVGDTLDGKLYAYSAPR